MNNGFGKRRQPLRMSYRRTPVSRFVLEHPGSESGQAPGTGNVLDPGFRRGDDLCRVRQHMNNDLGNAPRLSPGQAPAAFHFN